MLARLHAPADTRLDIGMSVRLVFEKAKPGLTLPGFVLAAPATDMSVPSSG